MNIRHSTFCKCFLFLLVLVGSCSLFSQSKDSVEVQLSLKKNYGEKIEFYKKIIDQIKNENFDKSTKLCNQAIALAIKHQDPDSEADLLRLKGNIYYLKGNLDSSSVYFYKSLAILQKRNSPKNLAKLYNDLGKLYRKTKDFPRALKNYDNAFNIYRQINDEEGLATIYNESGVVYEYMEDYDEAVSRYKKSLKIQEKRGDLVGQGYSLEFIGGVFTLQKKYKEAEEYLQKSLEIRTKTKDQFAIALSKNVLGNLFLTQNKFSEAERYFTESNETAQKIHYLDLMKNNYESLSQLYKNSGKYELAYQNLELFRKTNDTIFNLERLKQVEELSTKYETAEKDNEIILQKSEVFKRNVAVFSLLGLLLLGFIYYKNYQNKQKVKLQKEILHQQDLATKAVMNAEDNERKRMATHLHDGIGQLLSAVNMNVGVLDEFRNDESGYSKILGKTKDILTEAITDVRTLSHQIMPNMLIQNSLSNALRELIEKSNSPKLNISLKMEGLNDAIDQNIQVVLYRTIQECINNTIKHAEASTIDISIIQNREKIITEISDNGKGFNPLKVSSRSDGLGLENIKSRIDVLKGNLEINSEEGKGTQVKVEIPIT